MEEEKSDVAHAQITNGGQRCAMGRALVGPERPSIHMHYSFIYTFMHLYTALYLLHISTRKCRREGGMELRQRARERNTNPNPKSNTSFYVSNPACRQRNYIYTHTYVFMYGGGGGGGGARAPPQARGSGVCVQGSWPVRACLVCRFDCLFGWVGEGGEGRGGKSMSCT